MAVAEASGYPFLDAGPPRAPAVVYFPNYLARTQGGDNAIYARIGQTLVVIAGSLAPGELLRVADSLQRGFPSPLML